LEKGLLFAVFFKSFLLLSLSFCAARGRSLSVSFALRRCGRVMESDVAEKAFLLLSSSSSFDRGKKGRKALFSPFFYFKSKKETNG